MSSTWQTKSLSEVCQIKPPKSEARRRVAPDALVTFAPMEDLGIDRKYLRASQTKQLSSVVGSYTYFADGDVLLAKITPCFENGKLGIATGLSSGIGFGSSEFLVLRPSPCLDSEFLYYFLARPDFRTEGVERMGGAVGHQRVAKEFIESYRIPLPPLPEQRRIVAILDEAFADIATAKANAETNLRNARALFESHLDSVFVGLSNGNVASLERLVSSGAVQLTRGKVISKKDLAATPGDYPVYSSAKENGGEFGRYGLFMFDEELITWSVDGGGRLFHRPKHRFSVTNVGGILRIHQLDKLSYDFIFRALSWLHSKTRFDWVRKAHPSVILKLYDSIPLPSLEVQRQVAMLIREVELEVDSLLGHVEKKLVALESLKRSLLHQAFTGAL